jgi:dolichyl-phosphate beta-glucosyltransferase
MAMPRIPDSVSIIIPGYNEEKRILRTLNVLYRFCEENLEAYEVLFVDDGSTDHTWEVVNEFDAPSLRPVRLTRNRGKGAAVREGMLRAKGRYRFFTDADLPYDLEAFLTASELFRTSGCDMVVGARDLPGSLDRAGIDPLRKAASHAFSAIAARLLGLEIRDSQCGFKGFTAQAAENLFSRSTISGYAFDLEILSLARDLKLHICKLPVTLVENQGSKIHIARDGFSMLIDVLRIYKKKAQGTGCKAQGRED